MNNIQIDIKIGGIFSKFVRSMDKICQYNYDNFILYTKSCSEQNYTKNYFADIFDFNGINIDTVIDCDVYSTHHDISKANNFFTLKKACKSLKINHNILLEVKNYVKNYLPDNTLGVHVRLTDMHSKHPNYGILSLNDYIKYIDCELNANHYDCIFVSSDNIESIEKLQKYYGKLVKHFNCSFLVQKETDDNYALQLNNLNNTFFWIEVFTDMLILSNTRHLIHRISNYANTTLLFSDTIYNNTIVTPQ